jgi:hypothetical protein
MDAVLDLGDLNRRWFESNYCEQHHRAEYSFIAHPRGISLEWHVATQCYLTREAIEYVLSDYAYPWIRVDAPKGDVFSVSAGRDEEEEGSEDHVFVISGDYVYQSMWNCFPLEKRGPIPDVVAKIKRGEPVDYVQLLGRAVEGTLRSYRYFEPERLDFANIRKRYDHLAPCKSPRW